ncbi:unnamed protein product, partial [Choristocarpus tenellus]
DCPIEEEEDTPSGEAKEVRHQSVSLSDANMGQLTPGQKKQLVELLDEFRNLGVFPEDPKRVPPCSRGVLHIPLLDENCTPYAAKQRRFSPEETQMIQAE